LHVTWQALISRTQCPTPWGITLHKTLQNESKELNLKILPQKQPHRTTLVVVPFQVGALGTLNNNFYFFQNPLSAVNNNNNNNNSNL
jgi:hypothetical protein